MFNEEIYSLPSEKFQEYLKEIIHIHAHNKKLIYLDLLYWINMRKCIYNEVGSNFPHYSAYIQIYRILKDLTESSKVICPVSHTILSEIEKQADSVTRLNTCKVIDSLSSPLHLSFADLELLPTELFNIQMILKGNNYTSKYFLSTVFSSNPTVALLKSKSLNERDDIPQEVKNKIWQELYFISSEQRFKILQNQMPRTLNLDEYEKAFRECKSKNSTMEENILNNFRSIVREFNVKSNNSYNDLLNIDDVSLIKNNAPSIYILCLIHATRKRNINESTKCNDFFDDYHAAIALAYSDYFFTERNLCHLLTNKPFDISYSKTRIETNPDIVLNILNQIS